MQEKKTREYVHSVRIELAKLTLVGTTMTYQATGDVGVSGSLWLHLAHGTAEGVPFA